VIDADVSPIFVSVGTIERDTPPGYRVFQVQIRDVTKAAETRKPAKGVIACDFLRVACSGSGLEYMKAQLFEMAERLDGVVLVT
jgi:hypothetical protein